MAKKDTPTSGGVANERLAHRGDKGWTSPRDPKNDTPFDAIRAADDAARNVAKQRNGS